jgi:hypothetical protein
MVESTTTSYQNLALILEILHSQLSILETFKPLKIHGYLDGKPLKTTTSEKKICNYFLTSIFLDLTVRKNTRLT